MSGELSTSTLTYTPKPRDSGKTLYCRATNPELKIGVLDDKWELDVKCKYILPCLFYINYMSEYIVLKSKPLCQILI